VLALKTIGVISPLSVETATETSQFLNCLITFPCHYEFTSGTSLHAKLAAFINKSFTLSLTVLSLFNSTRKLFKLLEKLDKN
jgi:hypothetical protein